MYVRLDTRINNLPTSKADMARAICCGVRARTTHMPSLPWSLFIEAQFNLVNFTHLSLSSCHQKSI